MRRLEEELRNPDGSFLLGTLRTTGGSSAREKYSKPTIVQQYPLAVRSEGCWKASTMKGVARRATWESALPCPADSGASGSELRETLGIPAESLLRKVSLVLKCEKGTC